MVQKTDHGILIAEITPTFDIAEVIDVPCNSIQGSWIRDRRVYRAGEKEPVVALIGAPVVAGNLLGIIDSEKAGFHRFGVIDRDVIAVAVHKSVNRSSLSV